MKHVMAFAPISVWLGVCVLSAQAAESDMDRLAKTVAMEIRKTITAHGWMKGKKE